jgi:tetratricopeptide (TPR) repeat protein
LIKQFFKAVGPVARVQRGSEHLKRAQFPDHGGPADCLGGAAGAAHGEGQGGGVQRTVRAPAMKFAVLWLSAAAVLRAQSPAEELIEAGHWKQARTMVEARMRDAPNDPLEIYLMSQICFAFGDASAPMKLAEKALALDSGAAKYHRQVAEVTGVMAQHANVFQQLLLARRFKKEIDAALALDPRDIQSLRDLMEFYLLAPGIAGGNKAEALALAERIGHIDRAQGFSAEARLAEFDNDAGKKDAGNVEALLIKAAEAAPGKYKAQMELARFELVKEHRNPEAAEAAARAALRLDATRVDAYSALADVYASRGRWAELDSLLEKADTAVPDDWTPHYRAAEVMLRTAGNSAAALRNLRKYLAQEPEGNQPTAAQAREKVELARAESAKAQ